MGRKKIARDEDSGIQYDKIGRMLYNPEFHPNYKKPYTERDYEYMCKFCEVDGIRTVSFALGRPERSLATALQKLRKKGKFEYYKNLNKHWTLGGDEEVNNLFHIYECEDCILTFAVEQAFEEQSEVKCPVCSGENLRDVAAGEMKIKEC